MRVLETGKGVAHPGLELPLDNHLSCELTDGRIQLYEVDEEKGKKGVKGKTMLVSAYVPE